MVSSVTAAPQAQPVAQSAPVSPKPEHMKPKAAAADTVQVSTAAKAKAAAMQEATETPAQTAKEAQRGDRQAQMLLAKENAEKNE